MLSVHYQCGPCPAHVLFQQIKTLEPRGDEHEVLGFRHYHTQQLFSPTTLETPRPPMHLAQDLTLHPLQEARANPWPLGTDSNVRDTQPRCYVTSSATRIPGAQVNTCLPG